MSKWKIYTPEGVQDILFGECNLKRRLEAVIRNIFSSSGYNEVESPTIEFFDTFSASPDLTPQETMFKFFDQQGRILVLRPDATIPVARIAATKYKEVPYPLRFCYIENTFRFNELGGGKQKEFTQAGAEILGAGEPEADAEVIATAINCIKACGIENFQVDIGQVEFFKGLMEETGLPENEAEQLRVLIDSKDLLAIEEFVREHDFDAGLKSLILELPRLFGADDIIERVQKLTKNKRSLAALENLRQVLEILGDYGLSNYVSVDLGMVQSLNYYTGIIFRGFTYGVGFPVLSGGRYDRLVEKFGRECPATGFSLGINMVMMALDRQKIPTEDSKVHSLISYTEGKRKTAFEICGELRKQGLNIELDIMNRNLDALKDYALFRGIGGIIFIAGDDRIVLYNAETGEKTETTVNELLERGEVR